MRSDLVIDRLASGEVLVYDLATDQAHHLDPDAARVFDGDMSGDHAAATRARLVELGLLEATSRRDVLKRAAVIGAIGVPMIRTLTVPTAAQASTLNQSGQPCTSPAQCQTGLCNGGICA